MALRQKSWDPCSDTKKILSQQHHTFYCTSCTLNEYVPKRLHKFTIQTLQYGILFIYMHFSPDDWFCWTDLLVCFPDWTYDCGIESRSLCTFRLLRLKVLWFYGGLFGCWCSCVLRDKRYKWWQARTYLFAGKQTSLPIVLVRRNLDMSINVYPLLKETLNIC